MIQNPTRFQQHRKQRRNQYNNNNNFLRTLRVPYLHRIHQVALFRSTQTQSHHQPSMSTHRDLPQPPRRKKSAYGSVTEEYRQSVPQAHKPIQSPPWPYVHCATHDTRV
eukprot:PhF_6_TR37797/c0_g1_i2/m.56277